MSNTNGTGHNPNTRYDPGVDSEDVREVFASFCEWFRCELLDTSDLTLFGKLTLYPMVLVGIMLLIIIFVLPYFGLWYLLDILDRACYKAPTAEDKG